MLKGYSRRGGRDRTGVLRVFLISLGVAAAIYVATAFISAVAVNITEDPTGAVGVCALVSLIVSGALAGAVSARIRGEGGFGFALLVALLVALLSMVVSLVSSGGVSLGGLMNAVTYMGGGAVGAFLGSRRGDKRRYRRRR